MILNDLLAEIFGYAKYFEITSEFAIRGMYCNLAIKLEGKLVVLLEAKSVGTELKDQPMKQAIDYAANQGVDWVVLTNGAQWRVYKVILTKPIDQELVCEFDFLSLDARDDTHLQFLFLLTKEGWAKSAVGEFHQQKQALSRFTVGAALMSDSVLGAIRKELKRVSPDVRIEAEQISTVLEHEVIKREVLGSEKYAEAIMRLPALQCGKEPQTIRFHPIYYPSLRNDRLDDLPRAPTNLQSAWPSSSISLTSVFHRTSRRLD